MLVHLQSCQRKSKSSAMPPINNQLGTTRYYWLGQKLFNVSTVPWHLRCELRNKSYRRILFQTWDSCIGWAMARYTHDPHMKPHSFRAFAGARLRKIRSLILVLGTRQAPSFLDSEFKMDFLFWFLDTRFSLFFLFVDKVDSKLFFVPRPNLYLCTSY